VTLAQKIARLVKERGWSQEAFARRAGLSRHTARLLLTRPDRHPHVRTIHACAAALGLSVHDLTERPLADLLQPGGPATDRDALRAVQPALADWLDAHPDQAAKLSPSDVEELASVQGTGGPLTPEGLEHFVRRLERRRALVRKVEAVAGTEFLPLLEQLVELLYEKIQA
jgi:transcriptional regulator with XRE-family HTH domain